MKTRTTIKTLIYVTTLILGMLLNSSNIYAGQVNPDPDSSLVITVSTIHQSFDEALLMGLRALQQSTSMEKFGIINILLDECCVSAKVKLSDLRLISDRSSAEFIRKYVEFL
ncbi:MAG: hypothetical protein KAI81_04485 [Candidatus Marinimicrobia bacterium]|nr:hypothetical protein [Candidatus Neomarinimicrobiota bacterium]